jgi:AraC-like DNA-binding protein
VSTRGILRPGAVGRAFSLERRPPPDDLKRLVESHWIVAWELGDRPPYTSEVLPHPSVHLVFEPGEASVYGVQRRRYVRRLAGSGWAVGTKFLPGGFAGFVDRPVSDLTDSVFELDALFGADGRRLAMKCAAQPSVEAKLSAVHRFLRDRIDGGRDPRLELVQAITAEMRAAAPGERVRAIAERHRLSVRTMQRLFSDYVGVGPQWVLKRYRLHDAVEQIDRRGDVDWTRFALDLGYYDHAHFNRDFRALVGRTPAQYGLELGG